MMTADVHHTLIQKTYGAVGDPLRWNGLLGDWAEALEADSGLLFTPGDQFNAQPLCGHAYDLETAKSYGEYHHQHDLWTLAGRKAGIFQSGQVACGERLVAQRDLRRSLFYSDFLRPMKQEWVLCTVLFEGENTLEMPETVLSFYRQPGRRAFGRGATEALQKSLPHLQRCLVLHHELLRARADRSLFESGLDQLGIGVVLLNGEGRVQYANRQAEALIRAPNLRSPASAALLPALRQLGREAAQGHITGRSLNTPQGPFYAMAAPNQRALCGSPVAPVNGAVIWLIGARQQRLGTLELASSVFGLTRAEQKVLTLLMNDLTPRQIAAELGTELSTVRSQLSAILQKTGATRQQELVRLMAAFPSA